MPAESATAASPSSMAPAAVSGGNGAAAAAEASRWLFEGMAVRGLPSAHSPGLADAAVGTLPASSVDAILAADGLLRKASFCASLA